MKTMAILFGIAFSAIGLSQSCDTLIMHNGEYLLAEVVDINQKTIQFQNCPDSTVESSSTVTFTIRTQDILMINADTLSSMELSQSIEDCDTTISRKDKDKADKFLGGIVMLTAGGFVPMAAGGAVGYHFYEKANERLVLLGYGNLVYLLTGVTAVSAGVTGATAMWVIAGVMNVKRGKLLGRRCK